MAQNGLNHNKLLLYILVGIVLGAAVGGWFPNVGISVGILGDIFLNLLMMLVVPLVVLSMIVGITSLGNIRKLGAIGGRTILFYLTTTFLSVLIGMVAVNLIKPGVGISSGESHPEALYTIDPAEPHVLQLENVTLNQNGYTSGYRIILVDQQLSGTIESVEGNSVEVQLWEKLDEEADFYLEADDGTKVPFHRQDNEFVAREPRVAATGKGVIVELAIASALKGKEESSLAKTLKVVLVGDPEKGNQGLIPKNIFKAMVDIEILPLIFFSLLLGAALTVLDKRAKRTIKVISTLNDAVMQLVNWIMYFAPIGIFALIASRIGKAGGFEEFLPELLALGKYSLTVLGGLFFHGFITLPLILWVFARRHPGRYAMGVGAALMNAFSTASSSATLPLSMQGVEEENGVSSRTAGFVLPLGATINMDGTAMYESVAAIFIAQVYGIQLDLGGQAIIFFTATLAAIGAAGIPQAGLVTMVIVLKAVGLPIEGVALILTIDWLLDRFRTTINVWGDTVGAGVIDAFEGNGVAGREISVNPDKDEVV